MRSPSWYIKNLTLGLSYVQAKYFLPEQRIVAITFKIYVERKNTEWLPYGWPTMSYFPGKVA